MRRRLFWEQKHLKSHGPSRLTTCFRFLALALTGGAETRSNTSVCLKVTDLDATQVKKMAAILEKVSGTHEPWAPLWE